MSRIYILPKLADRSLLNVEMALTPERHHILRRPSRLRDLLILFRLRIKLVWVIFFEEAIWLSRYTCIESLKHTWYPSRNICQLSLKNYFQGMPTWKSVAFISKLRIVVSVCVSIECEGYYPSLSEKIDAMNYALWLIWWTSNLSSYWVSPWSSFLSKWWDPSQWGHQAPAREQ